MFFLLQYFIQGFLIGYLFRRKSQEPCGKLLTATVTFIVVFAHFIFFYEFEGFFGNVSLLLSLLCGCGSYLALKLSVKFTSFVKSYHIAYILLVALILFRIQDAFTYDFFEFLEMLRDFNHES